jgi:hypothetical protein
MRPESLQDGDMWKSKSAAIWPLCLRRTPALSEKSL